MAASIFPLLASMTAMLLRASLWSGRCARASLQASRAISFSPMRVQTQPTLYQTSLMMIGSSCAPMSPRQKQVQKSWYWWLAKQQRAILFQIQGDQYPSYISRWYSLRATSGCSLQKQQAAMLATASMLQFSMASACLQQSWERSRSCSWSQILPTAMSSLGSKGWVFLPSCSTPMARSTLSCFSQILLRQRQASTLWLWPTEDSNCRSPYFQKPRWQQHFPSASFHQGSSYPFASVASTASSRHFLTLCQTQNRYWKISLALERRWASFFRSAFELSKKFQPYCYRDAVASRSTLPLAVVGTPPFVIILPVLSMLFLDPAREPTLVPAR